MRYEIQKHWERIKKISALTDEQLEISYLQVLSKIKFIDEAIIPKQAWLDAEQITKDIDVDDTDFVALSNFLKAKLWTGDKALYNGLKNLNYKGVINTQELLQIKAMKGGN